MIRKQHAFCLLFAGNEAFDRITTMILGMPNLAGSIIACFLDNTVPGNYFNTNEVFLCNIFYFERTMTMILGMPNFVGSITACYIDNTEPF